MERSVSKLPSGCQPTPEGPPEEAAGKGARLGFIDDARGVAVVLMILWHSIDAWLIPGLESGRGWDSAHFLGGLAAPAFLFLAGVGVAMKASADARKGTDVRVTTRGLLGRGMLILVLGYVLRLQMWLLDGLAIASLHAARAWLPMALGLLGLGLAAHRFGHARPAWRQLLVGAPLFGLGVYQLVQIAPHRIPGLLRVDVLQCIGASICLVVLVGARLGSFRRPWRALALAIPLALITSWVASSLPGSIPAPIAAYLARWPTPAGVQPFAMFPLLPWVAYALAGAALGVHLHRDASPQAILRITLLGAALACVSSEALPAIHRLVSEQPWLAKLARASFRVGLLMVLLGVMRATIGRVRRSPLRVLGRASLLAYWVHLELVYGIAGGRWKSSLSYPEWLLSLLLLSALMGALAWLRLYPLAAWLRRRRSLARAEGRRIETRAQ